MWLKIIVPLYKVAPVARERVPKLPSHLKYLGGIFKRDILDLSAVVW